LGQIGQARPAALGDGRVFLRRGWRSPLPGKADGGRGRGRGQEKSQRDQRRHGRRIIEVTPDRNKAGRHIYSAVLAPSRAIEAPARSKRCMSFRCRSVSLTPLVCVVAIAACASTNTASRKMLDLNQQALDAFEAGKLAQARDLLSQAVVLGKKNGLTKDQAMARTYLDLAAVFLAMNERDKGLRQMGLALRIQPDIEPAPQIATAPVKKALARARAEVEKRKGQAGAARDKEEREEKEAAPAPPPRKHEPAPPPHAVVKATPPPAPKAPPPAEKPAPPPEEKAAPVAA